MSFLPFSGLDLAIASWVLGATVLIVFMVRRGHDPLRWTIVSYLLGPAALILAAVARRRARAVSPTLLTPGATRTGSLTVLVGLDGSRESIAALDGTIATFGDQIGRLTLAQVISFEAANADSDNPDRLLAQQTLADAARRVETQLKLSPRTVLLPGAPASALINHALDAADDVIVVGRHGNGESDWILGSVAADLVNQTKVRTIVMGATDESAAPRSADCDPRSGDLQSRPTATEPTSTVTGEALA